MKISPWIIIIMAVLYGGFLVIIKTRRPNEPTYLGRPLSDVLRNEADVPTNKLTLQEMLTLKQIVTGEEPEIATFELPISYDALQKVGLVYLLVDADREGVRPSGYGEYQGTERATNGNCLVWWNVSCDPPGYYRLCAKLYVQGQKSKRDTQKILGTELPFVSGNPCQLDLYYDERGAILYANLIRSNADYQIVIQTQEGMVVKIISGTTTNGVIDRRWDLSDGLGNICTNESFQTFFKITFLDQTNVTSTTRAMMGKTGN